MTTMLARQVGLGTISLFADLSSDELDELSSHLRRQRYARGHPIFFRGDPGTSLYLIEDGRVKITLTSADGREAILSLLGPDSFFGELALLDGEPRSADAVALEACSLLVLERDDFSRFLAARPEVTTRLLAVVSRRLRQNAQTVQDAAFLDVAARLARTLLQLAQAHGQPDKEGIRIMPRLTQVEIAGMIGASRESVNKWLAFYERQGLIRVSRGRITVLQPQGLQKRIY
jgi:CRP/FNR family cyclic AMP-dependent transcriptional regulator